MGFDWLDVTQRNNNSERDCIIFNILIFRRWAVELVMKITTRDATLAVTSGSSQPHLAGGAASASLIQIGCLLLYMLGNLQLHHCKLVNHRVTSTKSS